MKDCKDHYEYIARYVDDILVFSREPEELIMCLQVVHPRQGVGVALMVRSVVVVDTAVGLIHTSPPDCLN